MEIISHSFAKIMVLLTIGLCITFFLRKVGKSKEQSHFINKWNRKLRKAHIPIGITLIVLSLIHGLTSSVNVLSLNWGTACFVFILLLGLSYVFGNRFKKPNWMQWHRVLIIAMIITLFLHQGEINDHKSKNIDERDYKVNKSLLLRPKFTITIAQPGVSKSLVSDDQLELIASTEKYIKDSGGNTPLIIITSE